MAHNVCVQCDRKIFWSAVGGGRWVAWDEPSSPCEHSPNGEREVEDE